MFDGLDPASVSFDDDFDLFGPGPDSGNRSFDADVAATNAATDSTCSPLELQLSHSDSFFASQPPSAAQTYLSTPALDELSTPEDFIMSADNTPLFDHNTDFGGQHGGADLFPPLDVDNKDFNTPPTMGVSMTREDSADSVESPVTGYQPKTKGRKRTKVLEPIDPSQGADEAERKKKKNTLAARKSRARREAREQALESKNRALASEIQLLKQIIARAGLPLPAGLSFSSE